MQILQLAAAKRSLSVTAVPALLASHSEKRSSCTMTSAHAHQHMAPSSKPHHPSSFGLILEPPDSWSLQECKSASKSPLLFLSCPFSPASVVTLLLQPFMDLVRMIFHKGLPQLLLQVRHSINRSGEENGRRMFSMDM